MFCQFCGYTLGSGAFCPNCGAKANPNGRQAGATPPPPPPPNYYRSPNPPPPPPPNYYRPPNPPPNPPRRPPQTPPTGPSINITPMGYYKFLINFLLIFTAVGSGISAFMFFIGVHYGEYAGLLYEAYPALKGLDMAYGLTTIGIGAYAISVRMSLANYEEKGPKKLHIIYIAGGIISLIYKIIGRVIVADTMDAVSYSYYYFNDLDFMLESMFGTFAIIMGIVGTVVWVAINHSYFSKREHLFIN